MRNQKKKEGPARRIQRRRITSLMIIDGETVITRSFNFTKAAEEKNAENLLVVRDKALAEKYIKNWQDHAGHSAPYTGKGQ
jgi:phosphatidylserine/phosphatidylglycerophosphate/cardiolipin synthase-like enzyme